LDGVIKVSRSDYEKRLKLIVDQLPMGLLHRLVDDAQYFLDWYHSKKESRRKWRGKKPFKRFD
jgi:hypothetical protein|tara:strand:+ start:2982 stop:3170 length:189 start_codon:yes stop_codon:yes gene_type:complete